MAPSSQGLEPPRFPARFSYQFAGRENDGSTGLYYYRARYYSPTFGRFISQDPLGYPGGQDANLYRYALGDPVVLLDPYGLEVHYCGFWDIKCQLQPWIDLWKSVIGPCVHFAQGCLRAAEYGAPAAIIIGVEDPVLGGAVEGGLCVAGGLYYVFKPPLSPDIPPPFLATTGGGFGVAPDLPVPRS